MGEEIIRIKAVLSSTGLELELSLAIGSRLVEFGPDRPGLASKAWVGPYLPSLPPFGPVGPD